VNSATTIIPAVRPESTRAGVTPEQVGEEREMMRSAARILAQGGTKADVADYFYKGYGVRLNGYTPEAETPSMSRGLSMNALQGLTFGFGDEAMGAMLGLLTGTGASAGIDDYRAELQKFNDENPLKSIGAEVGGAAMLAPFIGGQNLPTLASRMGAGAKLGAIGGTAFGAGNAEGGLSERAKGAAFGGTAGLLLGGLTPAMMFAGGTLMRPAAQQVMQWTERLRGKPAGSTASATARKLAAEAIAQDYGGDFGAIERELDKLITTGAPITFADLVKDNGDQFFKAALQLRGPGKQRAIEELMTRQADQGDRITGKLFRTLRLGSENAYDAADDLMASRRSMSERFYRSAHQQEVEVTPELQKILDDPIGQQAYEQGRLLAASEDLFEAGNKGALKVPLLALDDKGKFTGQSIPVRALDYLKRGLDEMIDKKGGGDSSLGRQTGRVWRKGLNDALDAIDNPDYKKARAIWRGATEMGEALQLGKGGSALTSGGTASPRFTSKPPEVIKKELAGLTNAEREMYKLGAAQDVAEYLAQTTSEAPNAAGKMGGKSYGTSQRKIEKQVRALFDDSSAADEFMDYVNAEARISKVTGNLPTRGSQTAGLAEQMGELTGKGSAMRTVADVTLTPIMNRSRAGWTDAISDEVANVALKGLNGPDELRAFLASLKPVAPRSRRIAPVVIGQQASQVR
jgi:hypothetical protein